MMTDANDSFDLPRWQTHIDPLSSSAQAAHAAQASYYSNPPPPPPSSGQSLSPTSPQRMNSSHTSSRQPRISQLLEQDQPMGMAPSPYSPTGHGQLSRSVSLSSGVAGNTSAARGRRHHQSDDLEGAFNADAQDLAGSRHHQQPAQGSFYSPSVGYQTQSMTGGNSAVNSSTSPPTDSYDMYYGPSSAGPPTKRAQNSHESAASRAGRSPLRGPNTPNSATLLDPYSQQQAQYSPTTASYSYGPPPDQRPQAATYQSHSRNPSLVKTESLTPPIPTYTPQGPMINTSVYSPTSYAMDTSSPHPPAQGQTHLNPNVPMKHTISNPPTPLSYLHPSQSPSNYYPQDQSMAVDYPQKRRASGFRRVRNAHDLQPRVDVQPTGRRMGSDGTYLTVRATSPNLTTS